jgi:hypothetical protein
MLGFTVYRVKGHTDTHVREHIIASLVGFDNGGLCNTNWSYGKNHLLNPARCNKSAIFGFREQDKRDEERATIPKRRLSTSLFTLELSVRASQRRGRYCSKHALQPSRDGPPAVCRRIQDSEPIEIGEASGTQ